MRRIALVVMLLFASRAVAQSDAQSVPKRYLAFQGEWRVVSMEDDKAITTDVPEIIVTVTGKQFKLSGPGVTNPPPFPLEFGVPATKGDSPFRDLQKHGAEGLDDILDVENQIVVFWFVGIFKLTDDKLQLALKYCGQGVRFKNFRPPSSFDKKTMDGEIRIALQRTGATGERLHSPVLFENTGGSKQPPVAPYVLDVSQSRRTVRTRRSWGFLGTGCSRGCWSCR